MRLTCLLLALLPLSAAAEVVCPDSLDVQQQAAAPSAEWAVSYSDPPFKHIGVTVYDGPPSQNRRVRPATTRSTAGELRVAWRLPESRRSYYLSCSYERTSARLTIALPPGVNGCNAVFDRRVSYGADGMAVKRVVCN
ncbi:MAG TPA: STY0301 family protein [Burkholderiales bacterium]|jgi:hypothetical protein|nr:STY0301 family protein [Burkholderiales bacterium]